MPFAANRFVSFVFSRFPKDADGLIRFPDFVAGLAPFIVENPTEERLRGALHSFAHVRRFSITLPGAVMFSLLSPDGKPLTAKELGVLGEIMGRVCERTGIALT